MSYQIQELAKLSGISPRTLRHYDQIDLLKPARVDSNGYRKYEQEQVDLLQHILFYRELGVSLSAIKSLLYSSNFDKLKALEEHLSIMIKKREQLDTLITNVRKTIKKEEAGVPMTDKEKFEGFKKNLISENEKTYGAEIRAKYGDTCIDESNEKMLKMTHKEYCSIEDTKNHFETLLKEAFAEGNPSSHVAQEACEAHKNMLLLTWPEGTYSKKAHFALVESFTQDTRFVTYFNNIAPNCAAFFLEAIQVYCRN